ncbi:transcription factor bHLH18-like [Ipomoea triloba]|uniref:transcription factor bHLH18-like n=1 Tax=Ipomoea triloba TaxID=35885 RepID=UPI00125D08A2|nr:transcription factor bHLH18-like [Ipomoea triloba]
MEDSSISWFPELGKVDDYYDFVDGFIAQNSVTTQETQEEVQKRSSQSPESYTSDYSIFVPKSNGNNHVSGTTICFGGGSTSPESLDFQADGGFERPVKRLKVNDKKSSSFRVLTGSTKGDDDVRRRCSVAHEHVVAERKRRENLTRKFIALSAILPGLKKVDKASVLEEAIKHLKELKERVNQLEVQGKKTRYEESVVVVKTSLPNIPPDDEDHSRSSDECRSSDEASPEIEVRFSGDNILIRLHCTKKRGKTLSFFLREVEMLHLTVVNSFMTPFGKHAMDFTLVAQMDENFCMKPKDVVKHLQCITRS